MLRPRDSLPRASDSRRICFMAHHCEERGNGALVIVREHYEYLEEQARKGNLEPERLLERLIENGDLLWGEEEEDDGEEFEVETTEVVISGRHRELLAAQAARRNRGTEEYAEMLIEIGAGASFLRADGEDGRGPGEEPGSS